MGVRQVDLAPELELTQTYVSLYEITEERGEMVPTEDFRRAWVAAVQRAAEEGHR